MTAEPYTEGVEFILDEIIRYARMPVEELKHHVRDIAFYDIRDAKGHQRPAGRSAFRRLQELTERALAASTFARQVDLNRAFRIVQERFGETFVRGDLPNPSEGELAVMFGGWVSEAAEDCRPRVHIIPCDVGLDGVDCLHVGPVRLHRREAYWPAFETELEEFVAAVEPDARSGHRQPAAKAAREYLSAFGEVAEVEVPDCDGPTSRAAAETALQFLLDYIHVLAGAAHTSKMRGPGPGIGADRRSAVVRNASGLEIEYSVRWGGASISDEAWRQLTEPAGAAELAPVAAALQALVERRDLPLVADRFVDACAWYGDAVRDVSPAGAAVKYVTVMERLLCTDEQGSITRRVSDRLAALTFSPQTWNFEDVCGEVRQAYALRSGLLHGRISKNDPSVAAQLALCERHARSLLLTWLDRFEHAFQAPVTVADLRDYLNGFTAEARAAVQAAMRAGPR